MAKKKKYKNDDKGGYILLYRKLMENPLYLAEPFTKMSAWIDLLFLDAKDGSAICRSSDFFSLRWKWSKEDVMTFLNNLNTQGKITLIKGKDRIFIHIIQNYI